MLRILKRLLAIFERDTDPVRHCEHYRHMGCSHVDGPLCDMKACRELKDYRRFLGK